MLWGESYLGDDLLANFRQSLVARDRRFDLARAGPFDVPVFISNSSIFMRFREA